MVQVTPFLLVLCLALVAPVFSAGECVLTGDWVNDLGSKMTIGSVDEEGKFEGIYFPAVKNAPGMIRISPLVGYQHKTDMQNPPTFGFTVKWTFSDPPTNSITVFTGQYFVDETGKEFLKTMWLLRSGVNDIKNDWKATMVGTNTFTRPSSREQCGIAGGCKAHRRTCDANHYCYHPTCF